MEVVGDLRDGGSNDSVVQRHEEDGHAQRNTIPLGQTSLLPFHPLCLPYHKELRARGVFLAVLLRGCILDNLGRCRMLLGENLAAGG